MPRDTREAREALRSLLLPINAPEEQQALEAALQTAEEKGVERQDFASVVQYEAETWRSEKAAPALLTNIVRSFIESQSAPKAEELARSYFKLHNELQKGTYLLKFDQASAFLSHSLFIINLSHDSRMTASQVARILAFHDRRVPFSRLSVDLVLRKLKLSEKITADQIAELYIQDAELSIQLLADAELGECSQKIGEIAYKVGANIDVSSLLNHLTPAENIAEYTPYLQMLHYQCSVSEYFNYVIKDLYEFKARGVVANSLFSKYPQKLEPKGNPFLNNAKSVQEITLIWARSKQSLYPGASALYYLLDCLQSLGFSARRELCFWIRLWLHRLILLNSHEPTQLPSLITEAQATQLIDFVKLGNTKSSGVIEQRIVDAAAKLCHPDETNWKSRGLKDSVNTTNISRKKLGDCDFQNSDNHTVVAYEAHGGKLTDIYFKEHIRTLKRIIPNRIDEWETFSDIDHWEVKVIFVAHEIALQDDYAPFDLNGVTVSLEATTFEDFLDSCDLAKLTETIGHYVMDTLSETRVPENIRQKVLDTIS